MKEAITVRGVNPETLEVEAEVVKPYVYVLQESGSWDYEQTLSTEVFKDFATALDQFKQKVVDTVVDFREWCDEDETEQATDVQEDNTSAHFEIYQKGNYEALHCEIDIIKKEVK